MINARAKLAAGEPMTIDADALWQAARERMQAEIRANLEHRTAHIKRQPSRLARQRRRQHRRAPVIDGRARRPGLDMRDRTRALPADVRGDRGADGEHHRACDLR